jgi:hypothetical protein
MSPAGGGGMSAANAGGGPCVANRSPDYTPVKKPVSSGENTV